MIQHINSFDGGMKNGIDYTKMPQDSYLYMMAGCRVSKDKNGFSVTNTNGTKQLFTLPNNTVPIGSCEYNGVLYMICHLSDPANSANNLISVYSYPGTDGTSWQKNTLTLLPNGPAPNNTLQIPQSIVGFSRNKLLDVIYKKSYDDSLDLYICDGVNKNVVINTGVDQNGKKTARTYTSWNETELLLMKTTKVIPDVTGEIQDRGNLKPGSYFIYLRYEDESLNQTPFISESGPYYIYAGNKDNNTMQGIQNADDVRVSKRINLTITNGDTIYTKVSVGVIFTYGSTSVNTTEVYALSKSYSLKNGKAIINIDGNNETDDLLLEEILKDNISFNVSETHVSNMNRYIGANWKGKSVDNSILKNIAKRILPHASIDGINHFEDQYGSETDFEYKEDEIYPFGVSFLIDGQYKTPVFPICGWWESLEKSYTDLTVPTLITPETTEWIVQSENRSLIRNRFHVDITNENYISRLLVGSNIPSFGIVNDGTHNGLYLRLRMSIEIEEGTKSFTPLSKFKVDPFNCSLWLEDSVGTIYKNTNVNLYMSDFDDVVYTFINGVITLDLWKRYEYTGTVVSSMAEAFVNNIIISFNGNYTDNILANYNENLTGIIYVITSFVNNPYKVYVRPELQTVKDVTVQISIYNQDLTSHQTLSVLVPKDTLGEQLVFAGNITLTPTTNPSYIRIISFNPYSNTRYKVNEQGNEDSNGIYWKDSVQYYYYESGTFILANTPVVNLFISSTSITHPAVYSDTLGQNNEMNETVLNSIDNNLGLFKFPTKVQLNNGNETITNSEGTFNVHFTRMSVKFDYKYAKQYIASLTENIPAITGFYIVQGSRVPNFIGQGFMSAGVEAVGFSIYAKTFQWNTSNRLNVTTAQSTKIGSSDNDCCFPCIDGNNYRMFPVIKIQRSRKADNPYEQDSQNNDRIWRMAQDSISEIPVFNNNEIHYHAPLNSPGNSWLYLNQSASQIKNWFLEALINRPPLASDIDKYCNVFTDKFTLFSPDVMLNNNFKIPSSVYIKPKFKILIDRPVTYDDAQVSDEAIYSYLINHGYAGFKYKDPISKLIEPDNSEYTKLNIDSIKVDSAIITGDTINSNFHGFSSKMKSIIDVFGDDMTNNNQVQSNTISAFLNASRTELFKAGVLINRTKWSTADNWKGFPAHLMGDQHYDFESGILGVLQPSFAKMPFGSWFACPFQEPFDQNSIHQIVTNLSMKTAPYIGLVFPKKGRYLSGAYFDTENNGIEVNGDKTDYRNHHNVIADINYFGTIAEYITDTLSSYEILNEEYNIILKDSFAQIVSIDVMKGDIISQKSFMRCIRWSSLPDSTTSESGDMDYSWKYGRSINMFLQSIANTNLRSVTAEDIYYPFVLSMYDNSDEAKDQFVWKSQATNMLNESWNINKGYNKKSSDFKFLAYDELINNRVLTKNNRVYVSDVSSTDAIVDNYRTFYLNQYQDYNADYGPIIKLAKFNTSLFSIQHRSINQLFSSNELKLSDDSSKIIVGEKEVISQQYIQLAEIGTQHKESVCVGDRGIYGVDWINETIWRITTGQGNNFGVDELNIQKSMFALMKNIKGNFDLNQDMYNDDPVGIVSTFNKNEKEIIFTFSLGKRGSDDKVTRYSIVFNELQDQFDSFMPYKTNIYMPYNGGVLSFAYGDSRNNYGIHELKTGNKQMFYGEKVQFELSFVVNCASKDQDASQFEKDFYSHFINSSSHLFDNFEWETSWQESSKNPFSDPSKFWCEPEYVEHKWEVSVMPSETLKGPFGLDKFESFEIGSNMKGQWLKVTIRFTPKETDINQDLYIKNIVTNFLISFN